MGVYATRVGQYFQENVIDPLLTFDFPQTWTVSSGTGSASLDSDNPYVGDYSLKLLNTDPTNDLIVTNSLQSTSIAYTSNYNLSLYVKKSEALQFMTLEVQTFQNAVLFDTQTFVLGSETAEDDIDGEFQRFLSDTSYNFTKGDNITFTFNLKGKAGTSLLNTQIWIDGIQLEAMNTPNMLVGLYNYPRTEYNVNTGWAQYGDGQYTVGSPLNVAPAAVVTLDIDGLGSTIKSQLPVGVADYYDVATSKITPVASGDGFSFSLSFLAENDNANGYCQFGVDIGGGFPLLFRRTVTFPRGAGVEHPFTYSTQGYNLSTFLANGGIIKFTGGVGTTSIYDITLQIHRTHKAR